MKHELTAVVDSYPHTDALLSGAVSDPDVDLRFEHFSPVRSAFAAMAQRRQFDVSEMALATYVQARGSGSPITLLPVTMLARFQHPYLVKSPGGAIVDPHDLEGRRIGIQSYAQTTGVWVRGILSRQFGVDLSTIEWVALEDTHVAGFERPDNVVFAPDGKGMAELLDDGDVAAAIVSRPLSTAQAAVPLFDDLERATRDWYQKTGVLQINHMVCVGTDLIEDTPEVVRSVLSMFAAAREAAGPRQAESGPLSWTAQIDTIPFGLAAVRPTVEMMLALCIEQGLVGADLTLADLLHPALGDLESSVLASGR